MGPGMTDYVSKPINPQMLFAAIAKCGGAIQTDAPGETEFIKPGSPDGAEPDDAENVLHELAGDLEDSANTLQELMGELDDLTKEA